MKVFWKTGTTTGAGTIERKSIMIDKNGNFTICIPLKS